MEHGMFHNEERIEWLFLMTDLRCEEDFNPSVFDLFFHVKAPLDINKLQAPDANKQSFITCLSSKVYI